MEPDGEIEVLWLIAYGKNTKASPSMVPVKGEILLVAKRAKALNSLMENL